MLPLFAELLNNKVTGSRHGPIELPKRFRVRHWAGPELNNLFVLLRSLRFATVTPLGHMALTR